MFEYPYKKEYPLHKAIKEKNLTKAKSLINENLDIDLKDKDGFTPLHYSIIFNLLEITLLLIKNNANINEKDEFGNISLNIAIKYLNYDIIELLFLKSNSLNSVIYKTILSSIYFIKLR